MQAFNDFLVFGSMAIGSFSSGKLLANFGWATVNEVVVPGRAGGGGAAAVGRGARAPARRIGGMFDAQADGR